MKFNKANILKGTVVEIKKGSMMTKVKVDVGGDDIITVMVTDAALQELGAQVGDELEVLQTTGVISARELN